MSSYVPIVELKSKRASYFSREMGLFGNSRKIVIQNMQATANQRQVLRSKERRFIELLCRKKKKSWEGLRPEFRW